MTAFRLTNAQLVSGFPGYTVPTGPGDELAELFTAIIGITLVLWPTATLPGSHRLRAARSNISSARSSGCGRRSAGRPTARRRGADARIGGSTLTLGRAAQAPRDRSEDAFTRKLTGSPSASLGASAGTAAGLGVTSAAADTPEQLYALSGTTRWTARGPGWRRRWRAAGVDQLGARSGAEQGRHASLRRLLCDLHRGVRPPHRACRPAARGGGRPGR